MVCVSCKRTIDDGSKFCAYCGQPQDNHLELAEYIRNKETSTTQFPPQKTANQYQSDRTISILGGIAIAASVIILSVVFIILFETMEPVGTLKDSNIEIILQREEESDKSIVEITTPDKKVESTINYLRNCSYNIDGLILEFEESRAKYIYKIDILLIENTTYTGSSNEYTIYVEGNWGGGNAVWGYIMVLLSVDYSNTILFTQMTSTMPILYSDHIETFDYIWNEDDPTCCPSMQRISEFTYSGERFTIRHSYEEAIEYD